MYYRILAEFLNLKLIFQLYMLHFFFLSISIYDFFPASNLKGTENNFRLNLLKVGKHSVSFLFLSVWKIKTTLFPLFPFLLGVDEQLFTSEAEV